MPLMQKIINPGRYRDQVTIYNAPATSTRNDYGERTATPVALATVYAEKQDWSGREIIEVGRETPMIYTRFMIRWRSDVTANMTLTHLATGDIYRIDSVMDMDGTRRELVLMCKRNDAE